MVNALITHQYRTDGYCRILAARSNRTTAQFTEKCCLQSCVTSPSTMIMSSFRVLRETSTKVNNTPSVCLVVEVVSRELLAGRQR